MHLYHDDDVMMDADFSYYFNVSLALTSLDVGSNSVRTHFCAMMYRDDTCHSQQATFVCLFVQVCCIYWCRQGQILMFIGNINLVVCPDLLYLFFFYWCRKRGKFGECSYCWFFFSGFAQTAQPAVGLEKKFVV